MIMPRGQQLLLPANPLFVVFSMLAAMLVNMTASISVFGNAAWLPDLLSIVLVFWCVHQPRIVGIGLAFLFGVLTDVHQAALLGQHALSFSVMGFLAFLMHRRMQWFPLWQQALHLLALLNHALGHIALGQQPCQRHMAANDLMDQCIRSGRCIGLCCTDLANGRSQLGPVLAPEVRIPAHARLQGVVAPGAARDRGRKQTVGAVTLAAELAAQRGLRQAGCIRQTTERLHALHPRLRFGHRGAALQGLRDQVVQLWIVPVAPPGVVDRRAWGVAQAQGVGLKGGCGCRMCRCGAASENAGQAQHQGHGQARGNGGVLLHGGVSGFDGRAG